jgi:hypothetical protein
VCAGLVVEPAATRSTQVRVDEVCSFRIQPGGAVVLTSTMIVSNARGGRSASVRLVPGWNVGRLYPKGSFPLFVPLSPGYTTRRTASRRFEDAPRLFEMLRAGAGLICASTYTVRIPARVAP